MEIVLIAGVVSSALHDAAKDFPTHTVGETIGGFLYEAFKHVSGFIIVPLRTEVRAIGSLLLRFSVVQKLRDKIKEFSEKTKNRRKKGEHE